MIFEYPSTPICEDLFIRNLKDKNEKCDSSSSPLSRSMA